MKLRKKKRLYLDQIYKYNAEKNAYIIEISLDTYEEIFNGWDASSFKKRDLDPELLGYIEQAGYDIPIREKTNIHFRIPKETYNSGKEEKCLIAVKNNFEMVIHFINRELKRNNQKIFAYLLLGIFILISAYLLPIYTNISIYFNILNEGLFIGSWVLFWEAFSLFFFSSYEKRLRKKRYYRFLNSEIKFIYL